MRIILSFITIGLAFISNSQITINEVSNANSTSIVRNDSTTPDWIELYNPSTSPIDLEDFKLTDNLFDPIAWSFPQVVIQPGEFLIVFLTGTSKKDDVDNLETDFSLKTVGEPVYLLSPTGLLVDSLMVPDLEPDMSAGRPVDGHIGYQLFQFSTPGTTNNNSTGYLGFEIAPTIITTEPVITGMTIITIQNNSASGVIRFTVDGSTPTSTSTLYNHPIGVDVTLVLKVRCFPSDPNLLPSEVVAQTYFLNQHFTLPVISISTDIGNLYSPTGIFTNYNTDWRKPCVIEYFNKDMVKQFETKASIKPDGGGGGSRSNDQHSVTIDAMNKLYGAGVPIQYPLIPEKSHITQYDAIYLRNGSNYWNKYPQKDATFLRIMRETNVNSAAYTPVIVFVNGNYFGVYELREKVNEGYFETNYGNDPDSLDLLSVSYFYAANEIRTIKGSDSSFYAMKDVITQADAASDYYYDACNQVLDLDNFVDYLAGENWFGNKDWIYNNMKMARTRSTDNRWKFLLQDLELGLGGWSDYTVNIFDYFRDSNQPNAFWEIYNGLIQNRQFKNHFINRYADLMNTVFQPEYFMPIVDTMYEELLPELPRHFYTWSDSVLTRMEEYAAYRQEMVDQLMLRTGVVRNQIIDEFNLNGQVEITLEVEPAEAGVIKISTLTPTEYPWTGAYFNGVPVTVTAIPNPGWTFSNWNSEVTHDKLELSVTSDTSLVAIFKPNYIPFGTTVHVYPNPTSSLLEVVYDDLSVSDRVTIQVLDLNGQALETINIESINTTVSHSVDVSSLVNGYYFVTVTQGNIISKNSFIKI